ncbi:MULTISPECIES: aminoglycoside phosphotransferase family protein [unclassified Mesorhizobium]|uniref:aminoglycoside phosphotransferase family protein n=1 Tax=unclassified Mesorhizobium TaxID=325217 RepID=UPI000FD71D45|nr:MULTISPECIES: aminoglycoside phosphotransferase family protein [unclassified Mesorhizobium]TGQ46672.1 aminoglycoside phosphotransferase family protein [Mesorhizobium sp. M00.F.Ca.ET.216.01.1.1]TIS54461.1 MAG: aminoglycoside phosphotransferase family protein [Mesorhizobium sp.]TIS93007.1 MAG: aminoglycoside phosphotransferase family protein [Mesorhizobium sp.]TJW06910.1 MAG: aminoglycoside phosphotransferase family protein [Mesorhizobium sp.]
MEPALSIDSGLVRRLVAAQFPEWAGLPVIPVEPGGWDNRTFRLGDDMSVRLPSAAAYVAQVEKEHRWLPRLAPLLPLPIPVPLAKGAPAQGYSWPWSVYRWLRGTPATADLIADPTRFARSLAGFLVALYRVDATGGPPAGQHNFHRGGQLSVYDAETRAALSALAGRIDTAAAKVLWAAALGSEWQRPPVWVHGDVAWGNLLVEDGKLCGIIDFGSSAVGDPACDLVIAWTGFSGESRQAFRDALPLDEQTWARGRGWALWKALITASGYDGNQREAERSWRVIDEVLADHRRVLGA